MRSKHDVVPEWVFEDENGKAPFSKGTIRMDKKDMEVAFDMFYGEMGWDKATGAPTAKAYQKAGLSAVADDLRRRNLLPEKV
jgi:aldehyde:ferredoxin oxidoreductase